MSGIPMEAIVEKEAESIGGSVISQLFGLLRTIVNWGYRFAQYIISLISQHPEAALMGFINLYILFT
jgi:hypothetical protein